MAVEDTQTNDTTVQNTEQPTDNGAQLSAPVSENTGLPVTTEMTHDQTGIEEASPAVAEASAPAPAEEAAPSPEDAPASSEEAAPAPAAESAPAAQPAPAQQRQRQPSMAQVMDAETDEFAAYMSGAETLQRNAPIRGTVVRLEDNGSILVDIGSKSEGIIPRTEAGEDDINVGDEIECIVLKREDDEGHPVLSKRRADFERQKRDIIAAKDSGQVIEATVKEAVKGGLIVDLGVSAFIPASHVDQRVRGQMERLIGQVLPVKVIEVDFKKNRDKVIASHRLAAEEDRVKREDEAWANIEKDKIVEGIVRRITDFGAFIDLGGVDGLLHVREMAWGRVEHPSNVVKKGQKLQVLILDVNEETKRIALGLKQLLPDPWKKAAKNYRVGQTVTGKVVRLAPTVAFVEIEPGIEAVLPVSEIAEQRIHEPADVLSVGQEVEGRLKSIQTNQRRITMSLRAAVQERERREERAAVRDVNSRADADGPLRLGDLFGKELRAMGKRRRDEIGSQAAEAPENAASEAPAAEAPSVEEETPAISTAPEEVPSDITDGEPDTVPADPNTQNQPVEG